MNHLEDDGMTEADGYKPPNPNRFGESRNDGDDSGFKRATDSEIGGMDEQKMQQAVDDHQQPPDLETADPENYYQGGNPDSPNYQGGDQDSPKDK